MRGGSFLDDLRVVRPEISNRSFGWEVTTRRSNIGFRVAVSLPIDDLPEDVRKRLQGSLQILAPR